MSVPVTVECFCSPLSLTGPIDQCESGSECIDQKGVCDAAVNEKWIISKDGDEVNARSDHGMVGNVSVGGYGLWLPEGEFARLTVMTGDEEVWPSDASCQKTPGSVQPLRETCASATLVTVYSSGNDVRLALRREYDGCGRLAAPRLPQNRAKLGTEIRLRECHVGQSCELLRRVCEALGRLRKCSFFSFEQGRRAVSSPIIRHKERGWPTLTQKLASRGNVASTPVEGRVEQGELC